MDHKLTTASSYMEPLGVVRARCCTTAASLAPRGCHLVTDFPALSEQGMILESGLRGLL